MNNWKAALTALMLSSASLVTNAAPTLYLSDGTTTVTCADGAACDSASAANVVAYIGAVGIFDINVSTGVGNLASPVNLMDLISLNMSVLGGTGALTIKFSDTDYTNVGMIGVEWGGAVSGALGVTGAAYYGLSNLLFEQSGLIGAEGPFTGGAFAASFDGATPTSGPYSLTQVITISATGAGNYSGNMELLIPEPGALALVAVGLLGAAGASRRRITAKR